MFSNCILDDEHRLFNTNCRTKLLYENIKERCNCQSEGKLLSCTLKSFSITAISSKLSVEFPIFRVPLFTEYIPLALFYETFFCLFFVDVIDLADENGLLKNLPGRPPNEYATTFLPNRSVFILLQISTNVFSYIIRKVKYITSDLLGYVCFLKAEEPNSKQKQIYTPLLNGVSESIPDFLGK